MCVNEKCQGMCAVYMCVRFENIQVDWLLSKQATSKSKRVRIGSTAHILRANA